MLQVIVMIENDKHSSRISRTVKTPLHKMHDETNNLELNKFFYANVNSEYDAEQLIASLLNTPSVEAAYVKPHAESP